ncbi:MAG: hypothetical protein KJ623_04245 [Nanoarchaeota archaeon]|nr:hypothetical protein [Nanoarchaeota archaeon]MBU0962574.1 hypothetical protein [Nanoarchaeota archaeon]
MKELRTNEKRLKTIFIITIPLLLLCAGMLIYLLFTEMFGRLTIVFLLIVIIFILESIYVIYKGITEY